MERNTILTAVERDEFIADMEKHPFNIAATERGRCINLAMPKKKRVSYYENSHCEHVSLDDLFNNNEFVQAATSAVGQIAEEERDQKAAIRAREAAAIRAAQLNSSYGRNANPFEGPVLARLIRQSNGQFVLPRPAKAPLALPENESDSNNVASPTPLPRPTKTPSPPPEDTSDSEDFASPTPHSRPARTPPPPPKTTSTIESLVSPMPPLRPRKKRESPLDTLQTLPKKARPNISHQGLVSSQELNEDAQITAQTETVKQKAMPARCGACKFPHVGVSKVCPSNATESQLRLMLDSMRHENYISRFKEALETELNIRAMEKVATRNNKPSNVGRASEVVRGQGTSRDISASRGSEVNRGRGTIRGSHGDATRGQIATRGDEANRDRGSSRGVVPSKCGEVSKGPGAGEGIEVSRGRGTNRGGEVNRGRGMSRVSGTGGGSDTIRGSQRGATRGQNVIRGGEIDRGRGGPVRGTFSGRGRGSDYARARGYGTGHTVNS